MNEKQCPIVAIYKNGSFFNVEINGEKIDRLVSFEIKVENRQGKAFPSYHVEQRLPSWRELKDESKMKQVEEELKNVEFSFDENACNETEKAEKRVQRELHPRPPRVLPPPFINLPFFNLLIGFALGIFTGFLLKLILKF